MNWSLMNLKIKELWFLICFKEKSQTRTPIYMWIIISISVHLSHRIVPSFPSLAFKVQTTRLPDGRCRRRVFLLFPNAPQHPKADTFGDGGSIAGDTFPVRKPLPPLDRLLSMVNPSEFLAESPSLISSWGLLLLLLLTAARSSLCCSASWLSSPERNLSSQTNPEDPCLLKETADLCKPSIDG